MSFFSMTTQNRRTIQKNLHPLFKKLNQNFISTHLGGALTVMSLYHYIKNMNFSHIFSIQCR
jgi:hypothetical protein